jgi:hypothetical protein
MLQNKYGPDGAVIIASHQMTFSKVFAAIIQQRFLRCKGQRGLTIVLMLEMFLLGCRSRKNLFHSHHGVKGDSRGI